MRELFQGRARTAGSWRAKRALLGEEMADVSRSLSVVGVVLICIREGHGAQLPRSLVQQCVLRLKMELYAPTLRRWKSGRKQEVLREIAVVEQQFGAP